MSFGIRKSAKLEYIKCETKTKWRRTVWVQIKRNRVIVCYSERINTCAINFKYLKKQNSSFTFVSSGKVIFIFSFIITFEKYLYKIHGAGHVVLHKITSYVTCIKTGYVSELDLKIFLLTSLLSHVGV